MTTIAIDSTHIASDTLSVRGSYIESLDTGKIIKHGDHYYAMAGGYNDGLHVIDFLTGRSDLLIDEMEGNVISCAPDGTVLLYFFDNNKLKADPVDVPFAIGSGCEYAIAAMRLGKTAKEAVNLAKKCDIYTGGKTVVKQYFKG